MFDKIKDMSSPQKPIPASAPAPSRAPSTHDDLASITSVSSTVTIVGKISGEGTVKVFGRVEGEISAATVFICADATVEGNVYAQDLTVGGLIKGTMQAQRVKLLGTAHVEGDIFHQSLTIEENAKFEGSSRRKDNVSDKPPAAKPAATAAPAHNPPAENPAPRVVQQVPVPQAVSMMRASEG